MKLPGYWVFISGDFCPLQHLKENGTRLAEVAFPGETASESALEGAEFNSPFMEFSFVLEMRNARHESSGQLYTHKPLAIFVPRRFVKAERLLRKQWKMDAEKINMIAARMIRTIVPHIKSLFSPIISYLPLIRMKKKIGLDDGYPLMARQ